jgi:hypothetical protein
MPRSSRIFIMSLAPKIPWLCGDELREGASFRASKEPSVRWPCAVLAAIVVLSERLTHDSVSLAFYMQRQVDASELPARKWSNTLKGKQPKMPSVFSEQASVAQIQLRSSSSRSGLGFNPRTKCCYNTTSSRILRISRLPSGLLDQVAVPR